MDFDALVDKYERPIYNLILGLIGDRDEAADLTQETFVAAYKARESFRADASPYTWLYRIAVNRCKNRFKEKDRRGKHEGPSLDAQPGMERLAEPGRPGSRLPEEALQRKELRDAIQRAIRELPYDYRIVAVLRDIEGLSYQEVADAAGISLDVARTRIARARGMLRAKLADYLNQSAD